MRKIILALGAATLLFLTGCGSTSNLMFNNNQNQTSVQLTQKNFRVVRDVEAKAEATYIFRIGGLSPKALQATAYADMVKAANLKGSEALINTTFVVKKKSYTPLYVEQTVIATGQVVEFTK